MTTTGKLWLFDLDGTLVDSRQDIATAANAALRAVGLAERPIEVLSTFVGRGARRLIEQACGPGNERHVEAALKAYMAFYGEHVCVHSRLYPGIRELLDRAPVPMGVVTNKPSALARPLLAALGVGDRFFAIDGQGDTPAQKPDPEGVLVLCRKKGVHPRDVRFVGDTRIDAETARNAEIPFVGVTWGFGTEAQMREVGGERFATTADELWALLHG